MLFENGIEGLDDVKLDPNDFSDDNENGDDRENGDSKSETDKKESKTDENENGSAKADNKNESDDAKKQRSREEYQKRELERKQREKAAEEQKIRDEAKLETVKGFVKTNPWTDEPIKDKYDLEVYEIMKKLDEEGKDPRKDYYSEVKKIKVEKEKRESERQESIKKANESILNDINSYFKENRDDLKSLTHIDETTGKLVFNDDVLKFLDSPENQGMKFATAVKYYKMVSASGKGDDKKADSIAKKMTTMPSSTKEGNPVDSQKWRTDDEAFKQMWSKLGRR